MRRTNAATTRRVLVFWSTVSALAGCGQPTGQTPPDAWDATAEAGMDAIAADATDAPREAAAEAASDAVASEAGLDATADTAPDVAPDAPADTQPTVYRCTGTADVLAGVNISCGGVPACTPSCDAVNVSTCVPVQDPGGAWSYRCAAPRCTCTGGTVHAGVSCSIGFANVCDPVCSPPSCHTECPAGQCGNDACPACVGVCSEAPCAWNCRGALNPEVTAECGPVFGCAPTPPVRCTTTCRPPRCHWVANTPGAAPPTACGPDGGTPTPVAGSEGLDCTSDARTRAWTISCERPECEIRCGNGHLPATTCGSTATCNVDCANPTCRVVCAAPSCSPSADGGVSCSAPSGCTTVCACAVGQCSRTEGTGGDGG